jgi:two-component system sensor histidine kinase KdpD
MRSRPVGVLVAIAFVAASTALIYPLKHAAPVVSLGVVYLVGVLAVAAGWGLLLGLATAVVSGAAFNYFHIPPTGGFTISRAENSVALVVYLIVAVAASTLSEIARARRVEAEARREEADLVAATARDLLLGTGRDSGLEALGRRLTAIVGTPARVVPGAPAGGDETPLRDADGHPVAALELDGAPEPGQAARLRERIVPALEPLIAAALDRERLLREVVETQALRRSDEVKTALLRAVSHDLRTPLTSIMASGEALGSDALEPEERHELSAAVSGEARRLSDLIDKLLDLSRLQGGSAVPRRDWVALDEVIRAAVAELPAGTPVHLALDPHLPLVRVDAAQLERALVNVLDNAARHSAGRPVHVRAHARGDTLAVRIVDEGPGIAPGLQERVFEPFWRGGDGGGDHHGAGLGLAIARGFVEANGGRLVVEPNVGRGAVFVLRLPVEPVPVAVR